MRRRRRRCWLEAIGAIPGLEQERPLVFGGWESATRGAGVTLQLVGERLSIADQFQGVDQIDVRQDGSFEVLERVEGGKHQVSLCAGAPAVLGWATGTWRSRGTIRKWAWRTCARLCRRCKRRRRRRSKRMVCSYVSVSLPKQQRTTRVEKNMSADEIARELVEWIGAE